MTMTRRLRFLLNVSDSRFPKTRRWKAGKRWVVVRPTDGGTALLLARAANAQQAARVGDQTGGRVFMFLHTDDFWRDYNALKSKGVQFVEKPRDEAYGTVVVFLDLYGNRWDLVQAEGR